MIKLCFVTTTSATLSAFILEIAEYLHNTGEFEISFICNMDYDFKANLPDYFSYYPVKMRRGINVNGIKAIFEMTTIFRQCKFDIVQYSTPNASLYASISSRIAKIPVRLYCQWGIVYVRYKGVFRFLFKQIEKTICRLSTYIEPDSKSNLEFSKSERLYSSNKSSVVWNGSAAGVNLDKFNITKKSKYRKEIRKLYRIPEKSFVFGYAGRITRDKGINELLEVMKALLTEFPETYLLLVGGIERVETINEDLLCWAESNRNVVFCGFTKEVERYLSAMDCFVFPSYREGFGLTVIEAEAMGVPVIVTDIPGPVDAIMNGKTGIIVKCKNIESLKNAMHRMIRNLELCNILGLNGHQFVKDNFEQKELFHKILEDKKNLVDTFHD